MCVCVKISRRPGCERNWRSRWTAEKEAKKTKKNELHRERNNKPREEKIHRERDNILLILSLLLIRRRMYTKKIRAASRVIILL